MYRFEAMRAKGRISLREFTVKNIGYHNEKHSRKYNCETNLKINHKESEFSLQLISQNSCKCEYTQMYILLLNVLD